jgi:hypothetical protein
LSDAAESFNELFAVFTDIEVSRDDLVDHLNNFVCREAAAENLPECGLFCGRAT